ncbi:MAG: GGDEF domain-containing protein [Gammaproteobacteria bacterium]|nr:GGDEF domain-containing protein [Gammaproteobacteria bacterium]
MNANTSNNPASSDTNHSELMLCLYNLASIGEGQERKVDNEISQFKKMVKVGSPVNDLKAQISVISNALIQSSALPENKKFTALFRKMPATILLDEFLNQTLTDPVQNKLQNYRQTLQEGSLTTSIIEDLIEILETEPVIANKEEPEPTSEISNIISPLFRLCSQLELSDEQGNDLINLIGRSSKTRKIEDLEIVLEDVSELILSSIATCTGQFETFLLELKLRLEKVGQWIVNSGKTNQAITNCSNNFSKQISSQVNDIQTSFGNAENIMDLEANVSASLELILNGVSSFDHERQQLEEKAAQTIHELEGELKQAKDETELLKNNLQQQKLRELTDPLTKLPNRQAYNERLLLESNRFKRYQKPLSLILGDIDLFKNINDTHGHVFGDVALKETASILQNSIRATDFVARFGGEEFIIIMPETNMAAATKAVNKVRIAIQKNQITENTTKINLTMSFGVASFTEGDSSKSVLERADKALYRAKSKGRNQVCAQRK